MESCIQQDTEYSKYKKAIPIYLIKDNCKRKQIKTAKDALYIDCQRGL